MLEAVTLLVMPLIPLTVLYVANELYYCSVGFFRRQWTLITALVGTPVHEISHALVVLLFGMKLKTVRLYAPDPESSTLGYVRYAYNPFSFVHRVGMACVGLAPAIIGSYLVSVLLALGGLPLLTVRLVGFDVAHLASPALYGDILVWYGDLLSSADNWSAFVILMVAVFIGTHASPSKADMKGVLGGILAVGAVFWFLLSIQTVAPEIPVLAYLSPEPMLNHWFAAMVQMSALAVVAALMLSVIFGVLAIFRAVVRQEL